MTADGILQTLWRLEVELHQPATRRNVARLKELLHPDFEEFGRSGRRYSLHDLLMALPSEEKIPEVQAESFALSQVDKGVVLITYRSAHVSPSGEQERRTLRSSLWVQTKDGWQMRFHQGTPTDEH